MDVHAEFRHYCRNPKCRMKLKQPVANPVNAFCCRGCEGSFYRSRCVVCEKPLERKTESQLLCGRRQCRNAYRSNPRKYQPKWAKPTANGVEGYHGPSAGFDPLKNPINTGVETCVTTDRPWRVVVGPQPSPSTLHFATIGGKEAIKANDRANARHWREQCLIKPLDPPVNIVGGYKFPGAPVVDLAPARSAEQQTPAPRIAPSPDDLAIPEFLQRVPA